MLMWKWWDSLVLKEREKNEKKKQILNEFTFYNSAIQLINKENSSYFLCTFFFISFSRTFSANDSFFSVYVCVDGGNAWISYFFRLFMSNNMFWVWYTTIVLAMPAYLFSLPLTVQHTYSNKQTKKKKPSQKNQWTFDFEIKWIDWLVCAQWCTSLWFANLHICHIKMCSWKLAMNNIDQLWKFI